MALTEADAPRVPEKVIVLPVRGAVRQSLEGKVERLVRECQTPEQLRDFLNAMAKLLGGVRGGHFGAITTDYLPDRANNRAFQIHEGKNPLTSNNPWLHIGPSWLAIPKESRAEEDRPTEPYLGESVSFKYTYLGDDMVVSVTASVGIPKRYESPYVSYATGVAYPPLIMVGGYSRLGTEGIQRLSTNIFQAYQAEKAAPPKR